MPDVVTSSNLTLTFTETQWNAFKSALFAGRKIEAIKMIREILPRAGLSDAKSYAEKIEVDLRGMQPEQFRATRDSSPMLWGMLKFLIILAAVGFVVFMFLHK